MLAGATLELCSATPLDVATQADCADMLSRVIDPPPRLDFRTNPNLIAGLELSGPHLLIRNSWRADLQRITEALHDDVHHDHANQPVA
jgi:F-type H+-transporting ATPase subunit b